MQTMNRLPRCFINTITRKFSSSLYITGDKAQNHFVVLVPHLDFEDRLQNRDGLLKNIEARRLGIDLDKVEKQWYFYKSLEEQKGILEETRAHLAKLITKLKEDKNTSDLDRHVLHAKLVRDDLKDLKHQFYGIEENAALAILSLPNVLHSKTPVGAETTVHEYLEKPTHESASHMVIGKENNLIAYIDPMSYFLQSDAALFEFAVSNYFQSCLTGLDYIQFSNADFVRSIIVEGCGTDYLNSSKMFTLQDPHDDKFEEIDRLHLVGGASLYAFMAYFARHSVQPSLFPLRLFSLGRNYRPVTNKNSEASLFNVSQESVVKAFIATVDDEAKSDEMLRQITSEIIKIYEALGYHFKLTYLPASSLEVAESLRVSIQMYSNNLQKYIEVGNVSVYENYVSKRLLFSYSESKERKFPRVIAGNLLNAQKFLGCALENNLNKSSLLSDFLKRYL